LRGASASINPEIGNPGKETSEEPWKRGTRAVTVSLDLQTEKRELKLCVKKENLVWSGKVI